MVLLPEEAEMTLAELRQMAARQQHQIEAQQQLLIAKEQRLKFLKQQEARHHHLTELKIDPSSMQNLKEKVDAQGLKLRQLRALHGQVEQQKTNNCNLGAELESVRALFSEKEKELSIAVTKVEELTRQLNDIRKNSSRKSNMVPLAVNELENLRRELMYRTKLTEQQNQHISQQRSVISERQKDIHQLDDKIAELTQRLRRKRLMNQQLANQIHNAALARHTVNTHANVHSAINIAAVEPIQRELQDPDQTRDDLSAKLSGIHQSDLYEFSLKKNDPKYQTLPYNTKFHVKGKSNQEDFSPPDDDSSDSLTDFQSGNIVEVKPNPNMGNFVPRPFSSSFVSNNHISSLKTNIQQSEQKKDPVVIAKPNVPVHIVPEALNNIGNNNCTKKDEFDSVNASTTLVKQNPVQHNRPVFDKVESAADYKKTKEKFSGAVVKPVVPPKPSFPVKPVPPPRQTPVTPTKERSTEDTNEMVSKALSVLQNKSTEKEKNAFRYNVHNNTSSVENSSISEPKIATYFPKPSSVPGPNKNSNIQDNVKRKQTAGQLPIKPKPLTIRKTPGLEPPKLKQQQNSNTSAIRKVQETNTLTSNFKPVVSPLLVEPPLPQTDLDVTPVQESVKIVANSVEESETGKDLTKQNNVVEDKCPPFITIEEVKPETESPEHTESDNKQNESNFKSPDPDDSDGSSSSPCDSLECVPIHESSKVVKTEPVNGEKEISFNQNSTYHRVKGNLKTETSVRSPRRVSFDPLALLLDAALEGELELVKKTIREVPNPSAANDEGITALHNSICAGHFDVVTFLVEFGCDLNAPDSDGWTPLHCAASCNNLPMVKFLVERGACIFATTLSDHETAAEKCDEEEEGFEGCSEYLYGLQENLGIIYDGIVYAVYDYEGQNADELSFKDGDQIKVLRNGDEQEQEWWWARLNDEEGYIPRNLLGLYPRISIKKDEK